MGRGNNADTPYDDRGEGITSTQKVGNFFCCNLIWEGPKLPTKKLPPPSSNLQRPREGSLEPKQVTFSHFFDKIGSRARTRGPSGSGGVSKNWGQPGLQPLKISGQKYPTILELFNVDVIPLFLVGNIPILGGNNVDTKINKSTFSQISV